MPLTVLEHRIAEKHPLYREREAIAEAERCLYCFDPPCVKACPTTIDVPSFIRKIATLTISRRPKQFFRQYFGGFMCESMPGRSFVCRLVRTESFGRDTNCHWAASALCH